MSTTTKHRELTTSQSDRIELVSPGSPWAVPVLFMVLGLACLPFDLPVAAYFRGPSFPRFLEEAIENTEPWGHGVGAALALLGVWSLDHRRRRLIPWLAAASLGAGLLANLGKLIVSRTRPRDFSLDVALSDMSVWDTFTSWLPILNGHRGGQSFPSAHTTTAFGLSCFLAAMYPQGRGYFGLLAVLVALQRVRSQAHFPSDVCYGAALGWIVAQACLAGARRVEAARTTTATADSPQSC